MQSQLFFFKFHAHVEPYHQNMGLPARCLGSLFAKGWVILKDPLICSWGVVPRRVEPKLVYYDSRVTSAYFKILKKKTKNAYNIQGHTSTQKTSFQTFWSSLEV